MKKYDEKKNNVIGELLKRYRESKKMNKTDLCKKLQFHAVDVTITELKRIEDGKRFVKDFELIAFCKVLDIDFEELKNVIE